MPIEDQIINMPGSEPITLDSVVYRIFPFQRVLEMFGQRQLVLVRPEHHWEDPYENFLFSASLTLEGVPVPTDQIKNELYGQCWMLTTESDAMWRIYSPRPECGGVRVRSTVRKLLQVIINGCAHPRGFDVACFAGKVAYLDQAEILNIANEVGAAFLREPEGVHAIECLLIKREAYEHEQEVRLIYRTDCDSHDPRTCNDIAMFEFDPNLVFEEITFDSRFPITDYQTRQHILQNQFHYSGAINRSTLYDVPILNLSI